LDNNFIRENSHKKNGGSPIFENRKIKIRRVRFSWVLRRTLRIIPSLLILWYKKYFIKNLILYNIKFFFKIHRKTSRLSSKEKRSMIQLLLRSRGGRDRK
jgi:hypothetical protein